MELDIESFQYIKENNLISLFHDDQEDHAIGNGKTVPNMTIPATLDDVGENGTVPSEK